MLDPTTPLGTTVNLTEDDGRVTRTYTRSAPWQTANGDWVVLVAGKAGGYSCERLVAADGGDDGE